LREEEASSKESRAESIIGVLLESFCCMVWCALCHVDWVEDTGKVLVTWRANGGVPRHVRLKRTQRIW